MGLYLTVAQGAGTDADPRRPKYAEAFGVDWVAMDYGMAPVFLVWALLPTALETALDLNADFFTVPPLESTLTAPQVAALTTRLENNGLPAEWLSTAFTWRQVLRDTAAVCQFAQRANLTIAKVNLDQTFSQLPLAVRTRVQDAATALGLSASGITGATPVRQVLRVIVTQWMWPIRLGSVTL